MALDELVEVGVNVEDAAELGEGPAAEFAEVVDAGDPAGADGVGLFLGVFAAETFDLDDEVERVVVAASVDPPGR